MTENSRFIRVPLLAALMGLVASLTAPSQAATWYVRPAGGGAGTGWGDALGSFQAAIDSAAAGDEIWGASGVYNESLWLKAGIALYGGFAGTETVRENRDFVANPTILDATGLNQRVITADGTDGVTIDGFTIRNGNSPASGGAGISFNRVLSATVSNCTIIDNTAFSGGGVYCSASSAILTHCTISSNTANRGGGVFCTNSSPTLTHCTISDNMATSPLAEGGGVYCRDSSSPTLTHCTISGNKAWSAGGVFCLSSAPTLTHCTISGNTARGDGGGVIFRESSAPTLTHCKIADNSARGDGGGVIVREFSSPMLTDCTVTGNTGRYGGGVFCFRSSPRLTDCSITDNTADIEGGGVYCSSSSSPKLTHCTISGNRADKDGGGVYCSSSSPTLTNTTISGNTAYFSGGGVYCSSSSPTLTNCILWNTGTEIFVASGAPVVRYSCAQGGYPGEGNIDAYPRFVDPLNGDWRLLDGSPCIDRGTDVGLTFNGAGPDIGSWEAPETYSQGPPDPVPHLFRVNHAALPGGDGLSWETAFSSITEALFLLSNSDELWVAAGTYNESITMITGLALYGGFAGTELVREDRDFASNPTILDATGLNQRVITADGADGVTIDGFTIQNGNSSESGGGVYFNNVSSATVSNCTISGNTANNNGGGVFCDRSSPTLRFCTIIANTASIIGGGVASNSSSSPTLTNCTIADNRASMSGGGVSCERSSLTLKHCTISGNTALNNGGGVACYSSSSATLTNCTISGNTASNNGGGVACYSSSSATLTNCTISGNTADDGGGVYCYYTASPPTLTHCNIAANTATGSFGNGGGVSCERSSPTLTHCTITDNTAYAGGGVFYSNTASPPTLTHCTISANTAYTGGGVFCTQSSPGLTHCTITDNTATIGGGLRCSRSSPTMTHCTISGNTAGDQGGGVFVGGFSSSSPTLTNCILWNPGNEIYAQSGTPVVRHSCVQGGYQGEGNIDAYPHFVDPLDGDWRLRDGSPCIDRGVDVGLPSNGAGPDMGSWEAPETYLQGPPDFVPQIFRVDSAALPGGDGLSWETAFPSVGEALLHSSTADEIWVSAGTYNESLHLEMGTALYGGFMATETVREDRDFASNPTILDATGLNKRVITVDETDGVTIDGFTIRNGNSTGPGGGVYFNNISSATVSNCTITNNTIVGASNPVGAGVYCFMSSPSLTDCTISGNTASSYGGGVFCERSSPMLSHSKISCNTASSGGGVYCFTSSPTLIDCTITENAATGSGGGVYCRQSSSPTLTDCIITGNTAGEFGGGLYCHESAAPTLTHCTISDNTASDSGGGVYCRESSSPTLTHCTIVGNTASLSGGGVDCWSSSPTLTHCTISGNTASSGSGLHCSSSSPSLTNCILWNPGNEIYVVSGEPLVRYTCVQGGHPGEGNIDSYPHFVDPLNGDWRLRDGSPCIDRGTDVGLPFNGPDPDMGSWEVPESYSQDPNPDPPPHLFHVDPGASKGGDGLTWETAFSSVGEALLHSTTTVEVWVSAGTYYESIHLEMGSALYGGFMGTETSREERNVMANNTILDASGLNQRVITADQSEGVTIDGFTIRNGTSLEAGGGIYFDSISSATVSNCTISNNTVTRSLNRNGAGGGVYCFMSSPTLIDCTITENTAWRSGGGVFCSSSSPQLTHCSISDNTVYFSGGGVYCGESSSPTLTHCTISANTANSGGGVYCGESSSPTLTHCTISANRKGGGVHCSSSSPTLTDCTISDNTVTIVHGGGVSCQNSSSPTLTNCTISDNTAMGSGGGVYCRQSSSPTLTDCIITGNTAGESGGGLYCRESAAPTLTHCTISDNTANSGGGVYCVVRSSPTLTHCTISGNTTSGSGGGVLCYSNSSPSLTHCTISDNRASSSGGGVRCVERSSPTLTHCTISGNTANNGGGGMSVSGSSSSPSLIHCTITRNTANLDGGGIYSIDRSSPSLSHCTITGNTANRNGDGVASFTSSSPLFINTILWNGGDEVYLESSSTNVTFSAVQGGYPGQGNIDEDPMFVDPEQSDYRLSMGSPCIDSGSNGAVLRLGPSVLALGDHDGRMRIWDGDADGSAVVDMGAYEFGPPPFVGDVFMDSRVNHLDLFRFQQVWRQGGDSALPEADQDGDRTIGVSDLVILLHAWGNVTGP